MPIIYYASKDKAIEIDGPMIGPVGSMGFISFRRLTELFREVGETKPNEKVTLIRVALDGITFRVERH